MGWDVGSAGLQLVLAADVPDVVRRYLRDDAAGFLGGHGLGIDDIGTWVSHPGGPKVIEAIVDSLGLPDDALELTWRSLADIGNLSSSSVLHVLRDTIARPSRRTRRDDGDGSGLLLGTCSYAVELTASNR